MIIELREWESLDGLKLEPATVQALAASSALAVSPDRTALGRWRVGAQRFVGVTNAGGLEFRIAPKVPVHRLMELLSEAMDLADWGSDDVAWAESEDLLASIAASFVTHAGRAIQFGLIQGYVTVDDDLYSVRGRIDFGRQSGRPKELPLPIAVTFDEYTTNIPENQLLAGAGRVLLRFRSLPTALVTRLRRLEHLLLDVAHTPPSRDPPSVMWTRLNERYRGAVSLARLILQGAALDFEGPQEAIGSSLLIDMDKLFERLVGRGLHRAMSTLDARVQLQVPDRLDRDGHITIRPDVLAYLDGKPVAVADVKYKDVSKKDVLNQDVYQVLAYARRYELDTAMLIYPQPPPVKALEVSGTRILLHQIDLSRTRAEREPSFLELSRRLLSGHASVRSPSVVPLAS